MKSGFDTKIDEATKVLHNIKEMLERLIASSKPLKDAVKRNAGPRDKEFLEAVKELTAAEWKLSDLTRDELNPLVDSLEELVRPLADAEASIQENDECLVNTAKELVGLGD